MTDIATLEGELMRMVETATDEAALEAVRVAALGKKGSISALLATLGKMSPDERKQQGPLINGLKEARHRGDRGAARGAQGRGAGTAARRRDHRRHPADARQPGRCRPRPSRSAR